MSSAAVSDATTQPRSSRPRHSGRTPHGSRAAYKVFSSMNVRQNAPRTVGNSCSAACSRLESAAPYASNAPSTSESVLAAPGALELISPASRARVTSSALLTRLPLCPNATPVPAAVVRKTGWAFSQVGWPLVEYRQCPTATWPSIAASVCSSKT